MKKLFLISFFTLMSLCLMAQTTITSGMTGTQVRNAINTNFTNTYLHKVDGLFNIISYGAVGDDNTNNYTAIQNAINAAKVSGGTVYVPSGIYKVGSTLRTYLNVRIIGEGKSSVIKSTSADTLIAQYYKTSNADFTGGFTDIYFDGDNTGTIGLYLQRSATFLIENTHFIDFVTYGVHLKGSLVGEFSHCIFSGSNIGVYSDSLGTAPNSVSSNLMTFRNCTFVNHPKWAIKFTEGGTLLKIESCDIELNGVQNDSTTGCIYLKNLDYDLGTTIESHHVALLIKDTWFEVNNGYLVYLDDGNIGQVSWIENCYFAWNRINDTGTTILLNGTTKRNMLILRGNVFQDQRIMRVYGNLSKVVQDNNTFVDVDVSSYSYANMFEIKAAGAVIVNGNDFNSYKSKPAISAPVDGTTVAGYTIIYVDGVAYKIKLYQ